MDKISHEDARRLVQSAAGPVEGAQSRLLAEHLQTCAACRQFAADVARMESSLRRSLHERIDPAPLPPPAYREISARMRANVMKKQIFSIAGAAAILLLLIGLFANLPAVINQLQGVSRQPTVSAPVDNATPGPVDTTPERGWATGDYLLLSASGDQRALSLDSATGGKRRLVESSPRVTAAAWSPDGEWIAYIDSCEGVFSGDGEHPCGAATSGPEIFVMDANGGQSTRLTTASGLDWAGPLTWSPDGKWLAAAARPLEGEGAAKLYLIPLDGSGPHALFDTQGAQYPRWSPDGKFLGFTREENGLSALYAYHLSDNYRYPISARSGALDAEGRYAVARDGLYAWITPPEGGPADAVVAYLAEGPYDASGALLPGAQGAVLLREGIETPRTSDRLMLKGLPTSAPRDLSLSPDEGTFALAMGYVQQTCDTVQFFPNGEGATLISVANLCAAVEPGSLSWSADSRWLLLPGLQSGRQVETAVLAAPPEPTRGLGSVLLDPAGYDTVQLMARPRGELLGITPAGHKPQVGEVLPPVNAQNAPGELVFSASDEPVTSGGVIVTHLYAMQPDGTGLQRLLEEDANQYGAVLSPDGSAVAFLRQEGYVPDVPYFPARPYVLKLGESQPLEIIAQDFPTTIVQGEAEAPRDPRPGDILFPLYGTPAWSPDGSRLAFSVIASGIADNKIAVVPTDGSLQARYVTVAFSAEGGPQPQWSPDGDWLVFSLGEYEHSDLYLLHARAEEGAVPIKLTDTQDRSEGRGAVWSPDGQRLAYFARLSGETKGTEVRLIRPNGTDVQTLVSFEDRSEEQYPFLYNLQWSPDGRYVSYEVNDRQDYGVQQFRLELVDVESGEARTLVVLDESLHTYTWSPDGQWLAYSTETGIWVVNAAEALGGVSGPVKISDLTWAWSLNWR